MTKTIITAMLCTMALLAATSCGNASYEPLNTSTEQLMIVLRCIDRDGNNLLDNKAFADRISIEGEASHSKIKHDLCNSATGGKHISFAAELPDQDDMTWSKDRSEAAGISTMTIRFGKHKVALKCHIKYTANRPPAAPGGIATLEEVSCNNRSFKRSGRTVAITLRMDADGNVLPSYPS